MNAPIHTGLALSDKADPAHVLQIISEGIDDARAAGEPDWSGAVDALIAECIRLNVCFSSGEIAAWLRTYRPDLRFSITHNIGPYVRGRFTGGSLPDYTSGPVEQKGRQTCGYSNAPVGTTVYVYGPDSFAISTHRFEVAIPAPGGAMPDLTDLPEVPTQPSTPLQPVLTIPSAKSSQPAPKAIGRGGTFASSYTASVHVDHRLCVPRRAFEALASRQQRSISGGDDVYVAFSDDDITISLDPVQGGRRYTLVTSRCRLLFASRSGTPFSTSDRFSVSVTDGALKLDTSSPL